MRYLQTRYLENGSELVLRNAEAEDAEALLRVFDRTHEETDYLLTYPEERSITPEEEEQYLRRNEESDRDIEILAFLEGKLVGMAGINAAGSRIKTRHRATFGISILKEYWGMGIGRCLTEACIACAKKAGYAQIELDVVAENERAIALYTSFGFTEFGRNPLGFRTKDGRYQELVDMRLPLSGGRGKQ